MKAILLGIPASLVCLAASQALPASPYELWMQLGAVGILGFVVVWMTAKTLPRMTRDHRQALNEVVQRHQQTVDALGERIDRWEQARHEESLRLSDTLRQLIRHCSQRDSKPS